MTSGERLSLRFTSVPEPCSLSAKASRKMNKWNTNRSVCGAETAGRDIGELVVWNSGTAAGCLCLQLHLFSGSTGKFLITNFPELCIESAVLTQALDVFLKDVCVRSRSHKCTRKLSCISQRKNCRGGQRALGASGAVGSLATAKLPQQ